MTTKKGVLVCLAASLAVVGCQAPPEAPLNPTWADVEPILQGECNHCHGATAAVTGSVGTATYRFDFFDMGVCGEAAAAMDVPALASASVALIKADITAKNGVRPRMPPAPAPELHDWERDTLLRWAERPTKGPPPPSNRRPRISVNQLPSATAKGKLDFIATIDDLDADSVIGVIQLGDRVFKMDHAGSFAVSIDVYGMANGMQPLTATLCDGWGNVYYELGPVNVKN